MNSITAGAVAISSAATTVVGEIDERKVNKVGAHRKQQSYRAVTSIKD